MQSRRAFFHSIVNIAAPSEAKKLPVRPPYSQSESLFQKHCPECSAPCINACEEGILVLGKKRIPEMVFEGSGCTYCEKCAEVCEPDVLSLKNVQTRIPANIKLNTDQCLSWNETMCFSCKDACGENAITFKGVFKPAIDMESCTGCGFCIGPCPSQAIELIPIPLMEVPS